MRPQTLPAWIMAAILVIMTLAGCGSAGGDFPVFTAIAHPRLTTSTPTDLPLTPTGTVDNGLNSLLPPGFLTDPNTACAIHEYIGFSCLDQTGWHIFPQEINKFYLPNTMTYCLDGRIYISLYDKIYQVIFNKIGQVYNRSLVYLRNIGANHIYCGQGNEIWADTSQSTTLSGFCCMSRFDGNSWTDYSLEDIFGSSIQESESGIEDTAVAPNGNVWVIHREVLATFDGSRWQIVTTIPGEYLAPSGEYQAPIDFLVDLSGNVWAHTDHNLLMYYGNQWSAFPVPDVGIYSMALDKHNRIWAAGTQDGKIYMFDPQTQSWSLQSGSHMFGVSGRYGIRSIQFDDQDRLWVATNYGVEVFDGTSWFIDNYDLYASLVVDIQIFGDGPALPYRDRPTGSIRGRLGNPASSPDTNAQAEICLRPLEPVTRAGPPVFQENPCEEQTYHAFAAVDAYGNFEFTDVPAGRYYLLINIGNAWFNLVDPNKSTSSEPVYIEIKVGPGTVTQLGDIYTPEP